MPTKKAAAAKRPQLKTPTPYKQKKVTPKKRLKAGKIPAYVSKKTNPVMFNKNNPNHTAFVSKKTNPVTNNPIHSKPGGKFHFNPHMPPGLSPFSVQKDSVEKLPDLTLFQEKPISRTNQVAGTSTVQPVDKESRQIQTDATPHRSDAIMQTDNLISFPAGKPSKKPFDPPSNNMDQLSRFPEPTGSSSVTPESPLVHMTDMTYRDSPKQKPKPVPKAPRTKKLQDPINVEEYGLPENFLTKFQNLKIKQRNNAHDPIVIHPDAIQVSHYGVIRNTLTRRRVARVKHRTQNLAGPTSRYFQPPRGVLRRADHPRNDIVYRRVAHESRVNKRKVAIENILANPERKRRKLRPFQA